MMVSVIVFEIFSKFGEKIAMYMFLQLRVADAVLSSDDPACHFIPIQFILSWHIGVPFGNGLVSHTYMRFIEACFPVL